MLRPWDLEGKDMEQCSEFLSKPLKSRLEAGATPSGWEGVTHPSVSSRQGGSILSRAIREIYWG